MAGTPITLTIDGNAITAREGSTVLEACREAGIHIPTLCHDPRLAPYGACRLCIVEIEGMRGYPTSCTTKAADGMVVTTNSDAIFDLRKTVVELLLSDHKVDCITCESSGGCALQDVAYRHGVTTSRFSGERHEVEADDSHPLLVRDLEKCIMCGRCVRICREVQGESVYDYTGRGFSSLPNTPYALPMLDEGCVSCGQCLSSCPTGAITARKAAGKGRAWERTYTETTCSYCAVGCTLTLEAKDGKLVGCSAPLGKGVNNGNLCVKGRFGYDWVNSPERLTTPMIRKDGELVPASWDQAFDVIVEKLTSIRDEHGPNAIGGRGAARSTNEDNYIFQKFMRAAIGTNNVDNSARL